MMLDPDNAHAFSGFERKVAFRYLRPANTEGFISVIAALSFLGIMLGVATLVVVMSVMNGFRTELLDRILGVNGHFVVYQGNTQVLDDVAATDLLNGINGLVAAIPLVDGQALVSGTRTSRGVLARGIKAQDLERVTILSENLSGGALESFAADGGIITGSRLADALGVNVGDTVSLLAPEGANTPFGVAPRYLSFPVVGTFEVGMSEIDANVLFLPLETAQRFFNAGPGVSQIEIFINNPEDTNLLREQIERAVPNHPVTDWKQSNATLQGALEVERNVMFLILTMIVLVAALNIVSGMIMLVKDKNKDIAVLRAMGATKGAILRIFFLAGASIGISGTIIGCIIGILFCQNIETLRQWLSKLSGTELFSPEVYYLTQLPAKMDASEIIGIVLMALTLSFLATLYPSWRAASLDPVQVLRYE
ncbi:MAG: lipoprotein-releasing ABC transporter permease subunit [Hyphomicrobiales bacterium]|nr:lipoprotein-releasing ABC transporter permease subunit [Hyphomicrobiales bacterium]MCY4048001.1 lipoprotein-releasing ABC transporter permease subunit [Hyphomicrobiales bacterium]MCY4052265.1 lipoprotein-releasing ABC transporter permease subunit [Hyphomicrobiales bacterium]